MNSVLQSNKIIRPPLYLPNSYGGLPQPIVRWKLGETSLPTTVADEIGTADLTHTDVLIGMDGLLSGKKSAYYDGLAAFGKSAYSTAAANGYTGNGMNFAVEALVKITADVMTEGVIVAFGTESFGPTIGFSSGMFAGGFNFFDNIGPPAITANTLYHIILASRDGVWDAYVNGVKYTYNGGSVQTVIGWTTYARTTVGAVHTVGGNLQQPFGGVIDYVAGYNTAPSDARCLARYALRTDPDALFAAIAADNPFALYKFNEVGFEDSAGDLDLAQLNGVTAGEDAITYFGKSALFDGDNDVLISNTLPAVSDWAAASFVGLIRMDAGGSDNGMMTFGDVAANVNGFAIIASVAGKLAVYNDNGETVVEGNTTLKPNATYVAGVVLDGATVRLYLNGVADGTAANTIVTPSGGWTQIGADVLNTGIVTLGWLQELQVFNSIVSADDMLKISKNFLRLDTQVAMNVDRAIAGVSTTKKPVYSTKTHGTATYVRDGTNWLAAQMVDLTGIPVWQSRLSDGRGVGAFVYDDILIAAYHYLLYQNGDTLRVVRSNGTVETLTVHSSARVGTTDIQVVRTTAPVSANIKKYKVLPTNYIDYFHDDRGYRVPAVWVNQDADALVYDVSYIAVDYGGYSAQFVEPTDATRDSFYELPITGDSGCPVFLLINGELVLITTWTSNSSGPPIHAFISDINAAITALGSAGSLTQIGITGYRNTY